jgi:hypothetical protein
MPILQQIGLDPGQPTVMEMHKVIVQSPKVASAKKRAKKTPARRRKR